MKKFAFLLMAVFAVVFTNAQTQQPAKDITKVLQFTNDNYDFGKIPFGKPTEYAVTIKNISAEMVTLENVMAGCGCTTPKYERGKKIAPGDSAEVTLGFNGGTNGTFVKYVTLYFNDGMQKQVTFKGETYQTSPAPAPSNGAIEKMKTN
jgi:hypothetical protein